MVDIVIYDRDKHADMAPLFASIHQACTLENPITVATFVPPFTQEKNRAMAEYWHERLSLPQNSVVMAFSKGAKGEKHLAGYVVLHMPFTESGPFRAEVQKLFVHPDSRRQGIARMLMVKLEEIARAHDRTMLVGEPSPACEGRGRLISGLALISTYQPPKTVPLPACIRSTLGSSRYLAFLPLEKTSQ